jgi:hypothetical protein
MPEGAPQPESGSTSPQPAAAAETGELRIAEPPITDDLEVIGPSAKAKPDRKPPVALIAGLVGAVGLVAGLGGIIVMRQALVEAAPVLAPVFEAASEKHPDFVFAKVNSDEEQALAGQFGIRSIPTLMVFREQVILFSEAGALPAPQLDALLEQARTLDMAEVHREIAEREGGGPDAGTA